jgi:hypothetical protein
MVQFTVFGASVAMGNWGMVFWVCPILCPPSREIASKTASSEGWT